MGTKCAPSRRRYNPPVPLQTLPDGGLFPSVSHPLYPISKSSVTTAPAVAESSIQASPHADPAADQYSRHFNTSHLRSDLKGRAVRGGAVTLTAQAAKFILQLVSTIILARLLTPADFGLVAMVTALTGFVAMFKDAGLSMATVQRDHITHAQVSTLFWVNVALSVALMILIAAIAPAVAWFYGEPDLFYVTLAIAATFMFGGLAVQHLALLKRQMRFTALAVNDVAAATAGVTTGIILALLGAGYWALVAMPAATAVSSMILSWSLTGWFPSPPRRGTGVRPMLAFGGFLSGASFLGYIRRNLDNVLIGAAFGAVALGYYQKAYQILMLPIQQANAPITQVVIPALSRLQYKPDQYRQFYRNALFLLTCVGMPIAGFAFVAAEDIVLLLLGKQWAPSVPLFMALAPAAFAGSVNGVSGWIFLSMGHANRHFRAQVFATVVVVFGLIVGIPWGPLGIALGFSISYCAVIPVVLHWSHVGTSVRMRDVLASVWPPALATVVGGGGTVLVSAIVPGIYAPGAKLAVSAGAYIMGYVAVLSVAPHRRVLVDALATLLGRALVRR